MTKSVMRSFEQTFRSYKQLGEKAMLQVSDEALHWQFNEESNSIATIVNHLHGNMLSRWTDFLTSDGEKPWRQRDAEFEVHELSRAELMRRWEEGWRCLFSAIEELAEEDLYRTVLIRHEEHSVAEAINRQIAHYAYHVGQIVYIARMVKGSTWTSLSIPKNGTAEFNARMKEKGESTNQK